MLDILLEERISLWHKNWIGYMVILLFETTFILHLFTLLYYIYLCSIYTTFLHIYTRNNHFKVLPNVSTSVVRVTRCLAERRRSARVTKATAPEWCRAEPWLFWRIVIKPIKGSMAIGKLWRIYMVQYLYFRFLKMEFWYDNPF